MKHLQDALNLRKLAYNQEKRGYQSYNWSELSPWGETLSFTKPETDEINKKHDNQIAKYRRIADSLETGILTEEASDWLAN